MCLLFFLGSSIHAAREGRATISDTSRSKTTGVSG